MALQWNIYNIKPNRSDCSKDDYLTHGLVENHGTKF